MAAEAVTILLHLFSNDSVHVAQRNKGSVCKEAELIEHEYELK